MVHQFAIYSGGEFSIDNRLDSTGKITGAISMIRLPSQPVDTTSGSDLDTPVISEANSVKTSVQFSGKVSRQSSGRIPEQTDAKANILLVEDDLALCNLMGDILQSKGYFVFKTHSQTVALAELKNRTFQLLLTDIVIPGELDGIELANASIQIQSELSVIYMTGYTDKSVSSLTGPVLRKPVTVETLLSTIEKTLSEFTCH